MSRKTIKYAAMAALGMAMALAGGASALPLLPPEPVEACTAANSGENATVYAGDYVYSFYCSAVDQNSGNWVLWRKCYYNGGPGEPCMNQ